MLGFLAPVKQFTDRVLSARIKHTPTVQSNPLGCILIHWAVSMTLECIASFPGPPLASRKNPGEGGLVKLIT